MGEFWADKGVPLSNYVATIGWCGKCHKRMILDHVPHVHILETGKSYCIDCWEDDYKYLISNCMTIHGQANVEIVDHEK